MIPLIFPVYFLSILGPYLVMALGIFSAVLFMNQFVRVFNTAVMVGASMDWVFYSLLQLLPMIMALAVPMSFQLALLLTLGNLSDTKEMLALRAAGFSAREIIWPAGVVAVVLSLMLFWVNSWVSPHGFKRFEQSKRLLAASISKVQIEPQSFFEINGWKLYAEEVDSSTGEMEGVHMVQQDSGGEYTVKINAPRGKFSLMRGRGFTISLENGEFQRVNAADSGSAIMAGFKSYKAFMPFDTKAVLNRELSLTEMTTPEILGKIGHVKLVPVREAEYKIEAMSRLAFALSPIVFFIISCPLGLSMMRAGKVRGMLLSIVILFAYYGAIASGASLGKKVLSLAWYSPWLADILGLGVGAYFWKTRLER